MPITASCLPHEEADGPTNMARDEAMLDHVAENTDRALFRTYGWVGPVLSLGYFQSVLQAESDPALGAGVQLVRRATGGGAILHHREVTYALVVPREHPLARRSHALYEAVHAAVAATLGTFGVEVRPRGPAPADDPSRPFLCFADRDDADLILGPHKLVGSAQRRRSGAVLQHGSILLERSPHAPMLLGVNDLRGARPPIAGSDLAARLRRIVPERLVMEAVDAAWPEPLLAKAEEIHRTVYGNPAWTRRR